MSADESIDGEPASEYEVVIVGGGPAGCSAGVFTARAGLETVIFDRGRSSLRRCAHLENYLGFPAGIDIETFSDLLHAHVETAGCEIVSDLVESVTRASETGFSIETQEGHSLQADRVIAATRYGCEYLHPLDGDDEMFETHEHNGEEAERFDRSYADAHGRTPINGLYIASPVEEMSQQAITAAGYGAAVGRHVIGDVRREKGYWDDVAERVDWVRREHARDPEWGDRERWREYFDEHSPDEIELSDESVVELREAEIDDRLAAYVSDDEIERRTQRAHDRILDHLDTDRIRTYLDRVDAESGT
ncbi:NAD(P)/FAD-dependent oxidoreductase [Halopenitus persicus]|uniref:NAD(P)/FAD-dependent oxidoreductase n=1 Tax=Halopenitus persicus TaxID=1048396 RepID=UPI000BBACE04|nr:NAD(P)/FAD-dependent oxidoreductase [Halopenitus persicus]